MTYASFVRDNDGDFGEKRLSGRPCRKCGQTGNVTFRVWESSDGAYQDEKHHCSGCGATWWIDGIDS